MTFQQVLDMVRDTAKAVNQTGTFGTGVGSDLASLYAKPYPIIFLYDFEQLDNAESTFSDSDLVIGFYEKDNGEQDKDIHEKQTARMDDLARAFRARLELDFENDFQYRGGVRRGRVGHGIFQGIIGFAITMNITTAIEC